MKTKCQHCGKMTDVTMTDQPDAEEEGGEKEGVSLEIEGDAASIRNILSNLIPEKAE